MAAATINTIKDPAARKAALLERKDHLLKTIETMHDQIYIIESEIRECD